MALTIDTNFATGDTPVAPGQERHPGYRIEGEFREPAPAGVFAGGVRFMSSCDARVVATGPGPSRSPDARVSMDVYGLVTPPDGESMPTPAMVASPGFDFPDLDYRLIGSASIRTVKPGHGLLDESVVSIEGWVNFESGELQVEARPLT